MLFSLFFAVFVHTHAFDVVGWYIEGTRPYMAPEQIPWKYYTHIVTGAPLVSETGKASCNHTDVELAKFVTLAKTHGTKLVWRSGLRGRLIWPMLEQKEEIWREYRANYLNTIGQAVKDCQIDGIEFDYECPPTPAGRAGIVSEAEATNFTILLAEVKAAMGGDRQISCDMGVWGVTVGSYPLMIRPWVNVSMVKAGAIDYINTMSYHYPALVDEVFPWKKDAFILTEVWGLPKERINLGLAYFFHNGTSEPLWSDLSPRCPNIDPKATQCAGVHICGKEDNYLVGKYIKEAGFRGAFPWAANFDSLEYNNTLVTWLHRGLTE